MDKYKNMTPEQCAKAVNRFRLKTLLVYILVLIIFATVCLRKEITAIDWLYDYSISSYVYDNIHLTYQISFIIEIVLCLLVFIVVTLLRESLFFGIYTTLCDPEKYAKAEEIRCRKSLRRRYNKSVKACIGTAYHALNDNENAWRYYKDIVPSNPGKCRNLRYLCRLVSYFYDTGDMENATIYRSRLEEIKASGKKSLSLDLSLDNIKICDAIKEKDYDEAKELINKYISNMRVARITKTTYQYYLGLIAYELKDNQEAIYRFKTALETGDKLPFAQDARAKLDTL